MVEKSILCSLFRARDKPRDSVSTAPSFYFGTSGAGKSVTVSTAMQMSTVYACVREIAETIASLPHHVYEIARQNGWMSSNDIRELENLNPLFDEDDGNVYLCNGNMIPCALAGINIAAAAMPSMVQTEQDTQPDEQPPDEQPPEEKAARNGGIPLEGD